MNFFKNKISISAKIREFKKTIQELPVVKRTGVYILLVAITALGVFGVAKVNSAFIVEIPTSGGKITEGLIGLPRFINPVLATSDTDRDLSSLVYAGLLKHTPQGDYVPELAKSYSVSEDSQSYAVTLKKDLTWQDGKPLTADDVIFTIEKIKDEQLKSPRSPDWEGVTVEKHGPRAIVFRLEESFGPFLENLTTGILPKHIWKQKTPREFLFSKYNTEPIGSGPYKIENINYTSEGPPSSYTLSPFSKYTLKEPFISKLAFRFYKNENQVLKALQENDINSAAALDPGEANKLRNEGFNIKTAPLLRTFAVFFNHNKNEALASKSVRKALALTADKNKIVKDVLRDFGTPLEGPLPFTETDNTFGDEEEKILTKEERMTEARELIESAGWNYNEEEQVYQKDATTLSFTLATSEAGELKRVSEVLRENWRQLGVDVQIESFGIDELNQNVIRPREYDALLFGQVVGHNPDLYAFWHSSQRVDPGLNVGLFTSIEADDVLEDARAIADPEERIQAYQELHTILKEEQPAIFLYAPQFIYAAPEGLKQLDLGPMAINNERFLNISNWYLKTERVWRIFTKE